MASARADELRNLAGLTLAPPPGAPQGAVTPLEACVDKLRAGLEQRRALAVPLGTDPVIARVAARADELIVGASGASGGSIVDEEFSRLSYHPGEANGLELDRDFSRKAPAGASLLARVAYVIRTDVSDDSVDPISVETNVELYENDRLTGVLDEVAGYDAPTCVRHPQTVAYTAFDYQGSLVRLNRIFQAADGGIEREEKTIAKELLDGKRKLDEQEITGRLPDRETLEAYEDFDTTHIHYELRRVGDSGPRLDPFRGKAARLRLYRLQGTQGKDTVALMLLAISPLSRFGLAKTILSAVPDLPLFEEVVTRAAWERTRVVPSAFRRLGSDSFTEKEVTAPVLHLAVTSNQPLGFDNFAAYGTLTLIDSKPGSYHYRFDSSADALGSTSVAIDTARYTRESYFYDYQSPEVAALLASIRSKPLRSPREQALALLEAVNKRVSYSFEAVNADTVRPLKASQVLDEKSGVCQNFAALFVAAARGLGIPARTVMGVAIGEEGRGRRGPISLQAGYHAWAELSLDAKSWTPIEPQAIRAIGLPLRGYLPLGELAAYDAPKGADLSVNVMLQAADLTLDVRHASGSAR